MDLLLESPVREYSSSAEIQAWLDKLERLRKRHAADADALRQIEREEENARAFLAKAKMRERLKSQRQ